MPVTARAILPWLFAMLGACGGAQGDPHVKRGRELLGIGEADAAVRELRIALRNDAASREAKGLLLVALLRTDDTLATWYQGQILFERVRFLRGAKLESLDGFAELEKTVTRVRQELYDKGLDTRDAKELEAVTAEAARYSWQGAREADDEERDHAAFALALSGDTRAAAFLVDRLKSEKATYLPDLLAMLGGKVEAGLLAAATNRDNLARPRALDALALLREWDSSAALFRGGDTLRGVTEADLPAGLGHDPGWPAGTGLTRDRALYGLRLRPETDDPPLRRFWLSMGTDGAKRVLLLQAFDARAKRLVTRCYVFDEGRMFDGRLVAPPAIAAQLANEGAIVSATTDGTTLTLVQVGQGAVPVLKETSRGSYRAGDRVRVKKLGKDGVVRGADEFGLLLVTLDEPHRGVTQMSLTASSLRGLEDVLEQKTGWRTYEGVLVEGGVELRQPSPTLAPIPATWEPR